MAIGAPTSLGSNGAASGTTVVITVAANAPVGQPIVVGCDGSTTVSGVTDSQGNTYVSQASLTNNQVFMAVAASGKNLVSGTDTITVTYSGTITRGTAWANVGTGYTGTPTKDVSATGNNTSTGSLPTASLVTTQAAACLWANESYTDDAGNTLIAATSWTVSTAGTDSAAANPRNKAAGQYQVVSSTGTYATGTGGSWNPGPCNSGRVVAVAIYDAPSAAIVIPQLATAPYIAT